MYAHIHDMVITSRYGYHCMNSPLCVIRTWCSAKTYYLPTLVYGFRPRFVCMVSVVAGNYFLRLSSFVHIEKCKHVFVL